MKNKGGIFMAGSTNGPSVIWVAGETQGYNEVGAVVTLSGYLPASSAALTSSDASILAELNAVEAKLAASGILPNNY